MALKLTPVWKSVAAGLPGGIRLKADDNLNAERAGIVADAHEKAIADALIIKEKDDKDRADKKDREDREWLFFQLIIVEQFRNALEDLRNDLADLCKVTERAYTRALEKEQAAIVAFDTIRERAIVLDDGSRAYFARDGHALYGEDGHQITDHEALAQAHQRRSDTPTHEEFTEARAKRVEAAREVEQVGSILTRLDDLDRRIKSGSLTPADLAAAQKETSDIVEFLPAEAREEFERMHAARRVEEKISYRQIDPGSATTGGEAFQRTVAAAEAAASEQREAPATRLTPVYRPAEF